MEVLSCWGDGITRQFIARVQELNQQLDAFLPPRLRVRLAVPTSFVLYDNFQPTANLRDIVHDMQRFLPHPPGSGHDAAEEVAAEFLPNFRFWEEDEQAVYSVLSGPESGRLFLSHAYFSYLLENRTPPLPRWFVDGMVALDQNSSLETAAITVEAPTLSDFASLHNEGVHQALLRLPTSMFGRSTESFAGSGRPPAFLPMAELFSSPRPASDRRPGWEMRGVGARDENEGAVRWLSQSALFLHWAFHRGEGLPREKFWQFVERAAAEPVTEAMLREYFGLGYDEMDRALMEYFPKALKNGVQLRTRPPAESSQVTLRNATDAEIARIKGNLERLEIAYVKEVFPSLAPYYLSQARRTLQKAYANGLRDPRLLEVMGLCECDAGEDATARPLLESAVAAGATRPRVYYELARIEYQELHSKNAGEKLSARQTNALLELLLSARAIEPPLPQVYEQIALIWLQSSVAPSGENLAVLEEGIRYFPANLKLLNFTAVLATSNGFSGEAARLVKMGLAIAPEGPDRDRFLKLQALLAADTGKN